MTASADGVSRVLALTILLAAAPWGRGEGNEPARHARSQQGSEMRTVLADRHHEGHSEENAPPALYTRAQAKAGRRVFAAHCAMCHGPNLEGRVGPALKGSTFATPEANFKVRDVFTIVSQNMPAYAPGSLSHQEYVQVMAFLLQQNGYPAGARSLTYRIAGASTVPLIGRSSHHG